MFYFLQPSTWMIADHMKLQNLELSLHLRHILHLVSENNHFDRHVRVSNRQ